MRRHAGTGRNQAKKQTRRNARPRGAPKAMHGSAPSIVDLQQQVEALTRELSESLEQRTATAEVLRVISSSPSELQPIFATILNHATRICGAEFGTLNLYDGDFRTVAFHSAPPQYVERRCGPFRPHPESALGYVERTKRVAHIEDLRAQPPYLEGDPRVVALADLAGARTLVVGPLLKED